MTRTARPLAFRRGLLALPLAHASIGCSPSDPPPSEGPPCEDVLPSCPATPPSYASDVAPITGRVCGECHAPGRQQANRSLVTYQEVYSQRSAVLNQLHACKMPLPDGGAFSDADRTLIETWLVCGSPNN